jgi:hypothetical protein
MHSFATAIFAVLTVFLASWSVQAQEQDLFTALHNSNAGQFASIIQSDPALSNLFLSSSVRTVFAPTDDAINGQTITQVRDLMRHISEGNAAHGSSKTLSNVTNSPHTRRRSTGLTFPSTACW